MGVRLGPLSLVELDRVMDTYMEMNEAKSVPRA